MLFTDQLERKIDCLVNKVGIKKFQLHVHPYVAAYINQGVISLKRKWQMKYGFGVNVVASQKLAFLQYEFYDSQKQFIDMKEKGMSKGEFNSVAQANGGLENMINWEGKDKDLLALVKYIAEEDKLEKVLENPQVIKTPVVRNGKQSTLGYQPDIWKTWK